MVNIKRVRTSEQEAKEFIEILMQSDGNSEELSLNDFSAILDKYGINLGNYLETFENISDSGLNDNSLLSTIQQAASSPIFQYNSPTDTAIRSSHRSNNDSESSQQVEKTLDNMSLDELNSEKGKRVDNLNVKINECDENELIGIVTKM